MKGFNIPLVINIEIKYPNIIYKLNSDYHELEKDFNFINNYLFTVKNEYENKLDKIYQTKNYLRILYGKLFRRIKLHQEGCFEITEIQRYILNKTDYKEKIIDGFSYNIPLCNDYYLEYEMGIEKAFDSMESYMISLFDKNGLNFKKFHENMKIKEDKKIKGIYIKKCEVISMEEYIIYLFYEKLNKLPISQNILICDSETSFEEIQSFLYRAILCEYNTLFIIEISVSFSCFQHQKMYHYIDKILSNKFEKSIKENNANKNINKLNASEYIDSCIYFLYKNLENENSFLYELEKYTIKNINVREQLFLNNDKNSSNLNDLDISDIPYIPNDSWTSEAIITNYPELENIKVFSSELCGLGKSFKIKKIIKEKGEIYYHFPLGGILSKNIIHEKLSLILKKIENDLIIKVKKENKKDKNNEDGIEDDEDNKNNLNYNKVAIHLDIIETENTSLINEFLLSFLFTKFYKNNENIIYIPNNIKIYIEIPNSFENYLSKISILNVFNIENITLENLPKLELDKSVKIIFKKILGKMAETDEQLEKFIINNINLKEYNYYQIQTFINLFISQFGIFNKQIKIYNSIDITNECIKNFGNSTTYFTNGGFAKLLLKKKNIKDKIDLCLDAYENDLNNVEFKTPLIFIDNETKLCKFEKLSSINENAIEATKNSEHEKEEVYIYYIIDVSKDKDINAANDYIIFIFEELTKKYKNEFSFQFGAIFRDNIASKTDRYEYFPLTENIETLKYKISKITSNGRGSNDKDWIEIYEMVLKNNINWKNNLKFIIHISDADIHKEKSSKGGQSFEEGTKFEKLIKECVYRNFNIIGFKIGQNAEKSFQKISEIYNLHLKSGKDNSQLIEIYDFKRPKKDEKDLVLEKFHYLAIKAEKQYANPSYKYLKKLKEILNLPNDMDKTQENIKSLTSILNNGSDNYIITEDNYIKMILIYYRIKANLPVIIMGETGCGKTSLIKKLSQILNNGEEKVRIINIHPGIIDEEIYTFLKEINQKAKEEEYINKVTQLKKELWIFFDEINTCPSLSIITEIFINRTFNGEKLENNIRLIGA